jgi:hypothetical protein
MPSTRFTLTSVLTVAEESGMNLEGRVLKVLANDEFANIWRRWV